MPVTVDKEKIIVVVIKQSVCQTRPAHSRSDSPSTSKIKQLEQ
jgi:hypothetical protein